MAKFSEWNTDAIYDYATRWKQSLVTGQSLLWPGEIIWKSEYLTAFLEQFDQPNESSENFETKLKQQLEGQPREVVQLVCELLFVHFLFLSKAVQYQRKVELILYVAAMHEDIVLADDNPAFQAMKEGIGRTGSAYNTRRYAELSYQAHVVKHILELSQEDCSALLADHLRVRQLLDEIKGKGNPASRHILLHLLFPDHYERIASADHKQRIMSAFLPLLNRSDIPGDLDDALYAIRLQLKKLLKEDSLDFYRSPLRECWNDGNDASYAKALKLLMEPENLQNSESDLHKQGENVSDMNTTTSRNLILYGPPGTGKTFHVIYRALELLVPNIDGDLIANPARRDEAVQLYNRFVESNQVVFCTFHQSFSYEDFVEGIRFDTNKNGYEVRDGIFKKICNAAKPVSIKRATTYEFDPEHTKFHKMSLGNTYSDEDDIYEHCITKGLIALGWGNKVDYTHCKNKEDIRKLYDQMSGDAKVSAFGAEAIDRFKHSIQVNDVVIISSGNYRTRAIGRVTGEYLYDPVGVIGYHHFRSVEWLWVSQDDADLVPVERILIDKIFSQQTIYTLARRSLNMDSLQELISGRNLRGSEESQFVIIIDEINRGNISKIFGELITLIEPDKRINQQNELTVTLPYSGHKFGVPANVHILGTMNTADRSIALLDTALRRRFDFVEMGPDYEKLPTDVGGLNVRKLLQTINERIEYLVDRDHVIGHAYLITEQPSFEFYVSVLQKKIIPLLQEYFYDNWESIALVLGGAGKRSDDPDYLIHQTDRDINRLFGTRANVPEYEKTRYGSHPQPSLRALTRIYQTADWAQEGEIGAEA